MHIRSRCFALVLMTVITVSVSAEITSVSVDVEKKTVTPSNPRVNTARGSSLAIQVLDNDKAVNDAVNITVAGAPSKTSGSHVLELSKVLRNFSLARSLPLIQFEPCSRAAEAAGVCPTVTQAGDGVFHAVMNRGSLFIEVEVPSSKKHASFVLDVDQRRSALIFSGGLAGFGVRDERYRLDPIATDTKTSQLTRVPGGDIKKTIAASANYMGVFGPDWAGASFAIGANPSLDSLSFLAGPTFSVLTFENKNAIYVTPAIGYARHQKLAADFHGLKTVPSTTPVASLTKEADGWGFALMIGFGFAGNQDAFKFLSGGK